MFSISRRRSLQCAGFVAAVCAVGGLRAASTAVADDVQGNAAWLAGVGSAIIETLPWRHWVHLPTSFARAASVSSILADDPARRATAARQEAGSTAAPMAAMESGDTARAVKLANSALAWAVRDGETTGTPSGVVCIEVVRIRDWPGTEPLSGRVTPRAARPNIDGESRRHGSYVPVRNRHVLAVPDRSDI